jgi:hypothetical protein
MVADPLAQAVSALINEYHEAFLVALLGHDASTVSPERIKELLASGALDPAAVGRIHIPVGYDLLNPFEYMRLVSRAYAGLSEDEAAAARTWGLAEWEPHVERALAKARAEETPALPEDTRTHVEAARPELEPADGAVEPATPDWLSPQEQASHRAALLRAGAYARGLGNTYAEDLSVKTTESWTGETIATEGDAAQRAMMQQTIREHVAEAVATHRDAEKLARDLAEATGYYSHNWRRIAQTELQGAHNLGMAETAIDRYGEDGRVVRITESGACEHCLRLFRDADGLPRVFGVRELLENGTNAGRKAADWQATAWPVHPNCRCDTRIVPPGRTVTADGRMRREEAAA